VAHAAGLFMGFDSAILLWLHRLLVYDATGIRRQAGPCW
jgi:acid phosphatase family membrane protein YuiD